MAIQWGGTTGHMQVGIDVRTDNYAWNTASINVYVDFWVRTVGWGANDNQVLTAYINGGQWAQWGYTMRSATGATTEMHVGTVTIGGQGLSYGGGPYYTFQGNVSDNNLGGGNPSHAIGWTLPAKPPYIPGPPPTGVDSITATSARILVNAADARGSAISRYQVRVQRNVDGAIVYDNSNTPGTTSVSGLVRATAYVYFARALNGVGWGEWSTARGFTTSATVPGPPTNVVASNVAADSATLTWSAPAENGGSTITSYQVQTATDSGFTADVVTTSGTTLSRSLTGLPPGSRIYTRVRAVNTVGAGAWSAVGQFDTQLPAFVNQDGTWKRAMAWVKWEGAWRQARVWKRTTTGWTL